MSDVRGHMSTGVRGAHFYWCEGGHMSRGAHVYWCEGGYMSTGVRRAQAHVQIAIRKPSN